MTVFRLKNMLEEMNDCDIVCVAINGETTKYRIEGIETKRCDFDSISTYKQLIVSPTQYEGALSLWN